MRQRFGIDPTLVQCKDGVFDVWVDGSRIFSKDEQGRFPEDDEVLLQIAELAS